MTEYQARALVATARINAIATLLHAKAAAMHAANHAHELRYGVPYFETDEAAAIATQVDQLLKDKELAL